MADQSNNSVYRRKGRYVAGGSTEVGQNTIEWWERTNFNSSQDDRPYVVERKFEGRLDLIAALFFNEPRMWWVIAQYNNVLDVNAEIVEGAMIWIPTSERLNSILNGGKVGGVTSTRELRPTINPIV